VIPKGRWSFALYGHQLAKYELSTESQGFFSDSDPFLRLFSSQRQAVDLEVTTAAVATGWRMNDRLSLGLGLVFSRTSLRATTEGYLPDEDSEESYFSEVSFLPERRWVASTLDVDETDVTINAGVLGKLSEQVSGGLFYRQGPEVRGTNEGETPFPDIPSIRADVVFRVPDVLGGGLAWRSRDGRVTLATEVDYVGYAGQLRAVGGGEDDDDDDDEEEDVDFRDTWEYHFGAEYALLQSTPILAFRAGYWIEKYQNGFVDANDNLTHLSAGIGIAARSFQVDLAADFSDEVDTTSISFIYTF
jgi:long-chain fatty acid transport protein